MIVASVSLNHNSFGLRGMLLLTSSGEIWEALASDLNFKPKGTVLKIPEDRDVHTQMVYLGFECAQRLTSDGLYVPKTKVKQLWEQVLQEAGLSS